MIATDEELNKALQDWWDGQPAFEQEDFNKMWAKLEPQEAEALWNWMKGIDDGTEHQTD
jgi:hypothetical protein